MFYSEDIYVKTTDEVIGTDDIDFGNIYLPSIGEVNARLIGDEPGDAHFHILDYFNQVDYCIGIYDGKPKDIVYKRSYKQGILNNEELKVIDNWKNSIYNHPNPILVMPVWKRLAQMYDNCVDGKHDQPHNFYHEYVKKYGDVIPQFSN